MAPQHQLYSYIYKRSTNTFNSQHVVLPPIKQNYTSSLNSVHRTNISSMLNNHSNNVTAYIRNGTNSSLEFHEREHASSLPPSLSMWLTHVL